MWKVLTVIAALLLGISAAQAERIPLRDGEVLDREVRGHTDRGVMVEIPGGNMVIPWQQISPSYPDHPDHEDVRPRRPRRPPPSQQPTAPEPESESAVEEQPPAMSPFEDDFSKALLFALALFWSHILSVWLVSRENLLSGAPAQAWNLAALMFGLPVAVIFMLKYKGIRQMFRFRRTGGGAPSEPAECCLYTWDNQPLSSTNRKISGGLALAGEILGKAVELNASDVHFDTATDGVRVGMRVDGTLRAPQVLDPDDGKKAMAAIRMAAGMDLAKIHESQDGACHMSYGSDWFDLRIARAWAVNGETLVIRVLKAGGLGGGFEDLGLLKSQVAILRSLTRETAGIIIMAGPTGSGKTSTIYAMLRRVVGTGRNILTIEDPVEYRLDGATQISLNSRSGNTFADALKASMRHDPDVILVGEIRDSAAMDVAFQAALTGHLVFTTLHATSVLATYGRLHELGLSSYMINTGLKAMICQRLVRMLCPSCRKPYIPDLDELQFWGLNAKESEGRCFYEAVGCPLCDGAGYRGRRGVYRVLAMNNQIRAMVQPDVATGELQAIVEKHATGHVVDYAREFLWQGVTSPTELQNTFDMFDFGKRLAGSVAPAPSAPTGTAPAAHTPAAAPMPTPQPAPGPPPIGHPPAPGAAVPHAPPGPAPAGHAPPAAHMPPPQPAPAAQPVSHPPVPGVPAPPAPADGAPAPAPVPQPQAASPSATPPAQPPPVGTPTAPGTPPPMPSPSYAPPAAEPTAGTIAVPPPFATHEPQPIPRADVNPPVPGPATDETVATPPPFAEPVQHPPHSLPPQPAPPHPPSAGGPGPAQSQTAGTVPIESPFTDLPDAVPVDSPSTGLPGQDDADRAPTPPVGLKPADPNAPQRLATPPERGPMRDTAPQSAMTRIPLVRRKPAPPDAAQPNAQPPDVPSG